MNKKCISIIIVALAGFIMSQSQAQNRQGDNVDAGDLLLKDYARVAGVPEGKEKVEGLAGRPLSVTAENINLIRGTLARKISNDERIHLLGILARLYSREKKSELNASIVTDIKAHTISKDKPVARAATFALSRMGAAEDIIVILKQAKKADVIDSDEYAGELGHALRFIPRDRQREVVLLLAEAKSKYGNDVVTMNLSDPGVVDMLDPEALKSLEHFLRNVEPQFPQAIGTYGITTSLRYVNWLQATSHVIAKNKGRNHGDIALEILNDKRIDPRKLLAFLASEEGKAILASRAKPAEYSGLVENALQYAKSLPSNVLVNSVANDLAVFYKGGE